MVQATEKLTALSLATSAGSEAAFCIMAPGQLTGRVIQQFINHVAALHLQIRALPDGFAGRDRVAANRAAHTASTIL